jgi:carboxylesterase type B
MVFLHGGGFQLGSGSQFIYHSKVCSHNGPTRSYIAIKVLNMNYYDANQDACLARKGVVMVTPNYRLGVLGFLKVHGGDYNCGLWDQVRAVWS